MSPLLIEWQHSCIGGQYDVDDKLLDTLLDEARRRLGQLAERSKAIDSTNAEIEIAVKEEQDILAARSIRVTKILVFLSSLMNTLDAKSAIFCLASSNTSYPTSVRMDVDGKVYINSELLQPSSSILVWTPEKPDDLTLFKKVTEGDSFLWEISNPKNFINSISSEEHRLSKLLEERVDTLRGLQVKNGELRAKV